MALTVFSWWMSLCAISVLNVGIWLFAARRLGRSAGQLAPAIRVARWRQLLLAAVYVAGCGFRSFLPRADVQRVALVDSWLSSVLVGRQVATLAELCFAVQWALLLREYAKASDTRFALYAGTALVPLIVFAEASSWFAVFSTNFLGNAIEQSTWTFGSILIASSLLVMRPRASTEVRRFIDALIVLSVAFLVFMSTVDIPMYLSRWLSDEAAGKEYLSFSAGLRDAASRWYVTFEATAWRNERLWMSLYFSIGVWISIGLGFAPPYSPRATRRSGRSSSAQSQEYQRSERVTSA